MEVDDSLVNNLTSAIQRARRLRGHPVHSDTLDHWSALLALARQALAEGSAELRPPSQRAIAYPAILA